ncbi:MAG TPA: hypothetical protein V6C96_05295, partial [Vampirovibrionales bacterium]
MKKIATILRSASHEEYIAQIINPKKQFEIETKDYQLGSFVRIANNKIGLIVDAELSNPNSLTLTSQKEDFQVF